MSTSRSQTPPPPSTATPAERKAYLTTHPPPPTVPAYLAVPNTPSPLLVNRALYDQIQSAPRQPRPLTEFTLPIRSGRAWYAPAGSIIRISTPEGAQVGDLNLWSAHNPRERFWASRTKQLHASHVSTYDRLWSCLPYMRPLATIIADSLSWYDVDATGGRCHDLLGTRCDPYINHLLSGGGGGGDDDNNNENDQASYDYHCHSNLVRAVIPFGLNEGDVHDVINLFQVTGLDTEQGRYFMQPCPAQRGDYIELLAETDLLCALSTCPGGDLSVWGFGKDEEMRDVCRPLKVEVWEVKDKSVLTNGGWKESRVSAYKGRHGMTIPLGEHQAKR